MKFSTNNFLTAAKDIVTGGGLLNGEPRNDAGFLRDIPIPLAALDLNTTLVVDTSDEGAAADPVIVGGAHLDADETNGRVVKVEEATDTVFRLTIPIPRDYDEATDTLRVRVLASQVTSSTDNDVELDSQLYKKRAGVALSSDLNPDAPGTVLGVTEQWIEFDLDGNQFRRDDVANFVLITNGANDTNGEEVLIHAVEVVYRSCLVSYDLEDASSNALR